MSSPLTYKQERDNRRSGGQVQELAHFIHTIRTTS
jgi:hypothetical protein